MKKVYLVGRVNDNGCFTGTLQIFSSLEKAEQQKDYLNDLYNTCNYITEAHELE